MAEEGAPFGRWYGVRECFLLSNAQVLALVGLTLTYAHCSPAASLVWTTASAGWVCGRRSESSSCGETQILGH